MFMRSRRTTSGFVLMTATTTGDSAIVTLDPCSRIEPKGRRGDRGKKCRSGDRHERAIPHVGARRAAAPAA
jgi:hypothetical protein